MQAHWIESFDMIDFKPKKLWQETWTIKQFTKIGFNGLKFVYYSNILFAKPCSMEW